MQVGQCLVLIHLSHAQFLDQQFLNILQLIYLIILFRNLAVLLVDQVLIVLSLLILYHPLTLQLHLDELSLALVYLISLTSFPKVIVLFLLYSSFK